MKPDRGRILAETMGDVQVIADAIPLGRGEPRLVVRIASNEDDLPILIGNDSSRAALAGLREVVDSGRPFRGLTPDIARMCLGILKSIDRQRTRN